MMTLKKTMDFKRKKFLLKKEVFLYHKPKMKGRNYK